MIKINTIFDYSKSPPEPLYTLICKDQDHHFLPLYMRGLGTKIKTIRDRLNKIIKIVESDHQVIINDLLSHLSNHKQEPNIKNTYEARVTNPSHDNDIKKALIKGMLAFPKEIKPWMEVKAKSSVVYDYLSKRGVLYGNGIHYPIYNIGTVSGRSKTTGFNIQGTNDKDPIHNPDPLYDYFIHFDLVSADLRVAGYLSDDDFINESFINSDPYTRMEELLNCKEITRQDCKIEMLKSLYSANMDNPLFDLMPKLKEWIIFNVDKYDDNYDYQTILGMPVPKKNLKTSFNGIIQGSVAEIIQGSLSRMGEISKKCILAEVHDSIILSATKATLDKAIDTLVPIMNRPFKDIDISFPVKVSIGKKWKHWKQHKVFR